jgi:hypothetical protein
MREWMPLLRHTRSCGSGSIELNYLPDSWYEENASRMLRILEKAAGKLERALGLELPHTSCYVVEPETAYALQGTIGGAYSQWIVVGVPPGQFSVLARVGAHELAHILSRRVDEYELPFENEGFACWAAWLIGADSMPMGIPLHYHLGWLLSVGVTPHLDELWHRADYTPELYDLAWSFAAYVAGRFGQERYLALYRSDRYCLHDRLIDTLGVTPRALEREWHDHARRVLGPNPERVARMRRWPGYVCSRTVDLPA